MRRSRGFEAKPDCWHLTPSVGQLESIAKKSASAILKKLKVAYPSDTFNAHFPLQTTWGAVVSLNFDVHWLIGAAPCWSSVLKNDGDLTSVRGSGKSLGSELLRLNCHINLPSNDSITHRLWFPNGFLGSTRSLRLGLREFGFQPVAIHEASEAVKKYEREAGSFEQRNVFVNEVLEGRAPLNRFLEGEPKLPLT